MDTIKALANEILANPSIDKIVDLVKEYVYLLPAVAITGILLALSLIEVFAGKKLFGLQKFIGFFGLGLVAGIHFVSPIINTYVTLSPYIIGLVVGVVAALLYRPLYFVCYAGGIGFITYYVLVKGLYLPEMITAYTKEQMIISLAAAVVVVVIALLLRKWIEMLGLSALGACGVFYCITKLMAQLANVGFAEAVYVYFQIGIIAVVTLIGFIVQVKTRKRY